MPQRGKNTQATFSAEEGAKMQMTPEEICRHYVQAAERKKDITILAELNETDDASIRAVLIDG